MNRTRIESGPLSDNAKRPAYHKGYIAGQTDVTPRQTLPTAIKPKDAEAYWDGYGAALIKRAGRAYRD